MMAVAVEGRSRRQERGFVTTMRGRVTDHRKRAQLLSSFRCESPMQKVGKRDRWMVWYLT